MEGPVRHVYLYSWNEDTQTRVVGRAENSGQGWILGFLLHHEASGKQHFMNHPSIVINYLVEYSSDRREGHCLSVQTPAQQRHFCRDVR